MRLAERSGGTPPEDPWYVRPAPDGDDTPPEDTRPWAEVALKKARAFKTDSEADTLYHEAAARHKAGEITTDQQDHIQNEIAAEVTARHVKVMELRLNDLSENDDDWRDRIRGTRQLPGSQGAARGGRPAEGQRGAGSRQGGPARRGDHRPLAQGRPQGRGGGGVNGPRGYITIPPDVFAVLLLAGALAKAAAPDTDPDEDARVNGAGPLWVVGWIAAVILVPVGAVAAITAVQGGRSRRRRASVPRAAWEHLASLRPDPARPAEPLDPCVGLGPIKAPDLREDTRAAAITTLIATASRYLR